MRPQGEVAAPFKIEGVYCRLLPLTQDVYAIVWEKHYWDLVKLKWWARRKVNGYYGVRIISITRRNRISVRLQREVMLLEGIDPGDLEVDHENCNPLDNRFDNLRKANRYDQARNRRKPCSNTSGYKGVTFRGGQWCARIGVNRKRIMLGYFSNKEEAAMAYDRAALYYHGEFVNLNFPERLSLYHEISSQVTTSK